MSKNSKYIWTRGSRNTFRPLEVHGYLHGIERRHVLDFTLYMYLSISRSTIMEGVVPT